MESGQGADHRHRLWIQHKPHSIKLLRRLYFACGTEHDHRYRTGANASRGNYGRGRASNEESVPGYGIRRGREAKDRLGEGWEVSGIQESGRRRLNTII